MTRKVYTGLALLALAAAACSAPNGADGAALPLWRDEFVRRQMMGWRLTTEQIEVHAALGRAAAIRQATRQELGRLELAAVACPGTLSGPSATGSLALRTSLRAALRERPLASGGMPSLASLERTLLEGLEHLDRADELLANGEMPRPSSFDRLRTNGESGANDARCPEARRLLTRVRRGLGETGLSIREAANAAGLPIELWPALQKDDRSLLPAVRG